MYPTGSSAGHHSPNVAHEFCPLPGVSQEELGLSDKFRMCLDIPRLQEDGTVHFDPFIGGYFCFPNGRRPGLSGLRYVGESCGVTSCGRSSGNLRLTPRNLCSYLQPFWICEASQGYNNAF
ncbi:uncharacterized protein B0I36DRAFT_352919 [Microdochium trichocladiopsis]|uniref:Uncharacterized protein n=1 Tax=Microdochium trichocladiopsis TaxID=1682393 RepID=A0A9P9BLB2_9PEZI|nr:uncharacterized protein B0I36DRAFT_352919 [Microdochium trichocladiopsis]KAH7024714.1 hypothetical protein B0I36DRAFT_352919 [Microdochium trichocladiopsis]